MIEIYPDFYFDFQCKAEACLHSCCKGWEIDIDEETADRYRRITGDLGRDLRSHMTTDRDGSHFVLSTDKRCPMLLDNGLCRLILELGDDSLCDICALHPRFYEECGDYELNGLGLSCEKTSELLFSGTGPLLFRDEASDSVFSFPVLLERLSLSVAPGQLQFHPEIGSTEIAAVLDWLSGTEPINEAWTSRLQALQDSLPSLVSKAEAFLSVYDAVLFDKCYQYILYRQLEQTSVYPFAVLADYAARSTEFLFLESAFFGPSPEHIRRWSEQIEYSTVNVDLLLHLCNDP